MRVMAKLYASIAAGVLFATSAFAAPLMHTGSDAETYTSTATTNVNIEKLQGGAEASIFSENTSIQIRNATADSTIADYNKVYGTSPDPSIKPLWEKPRPNSRQRRSLDTDEAVKYVYLAILVEFPDDDLQDIHLDSPDALRALNMVGHTGGANYSRSTGRYFPIISMRDYFKQQSYGKVDVDLQVFPRENDLPEGRPVSFIAPHSRSYYMPYNAQSNPDGYQGSIERADRERELLTAALQAAQPSIVATYTKEQLDANGDGIMDAVNFIAESPERSQSNVGWSDLLWSHNVDINLGTSAYGLRVPQYTFNNAFDPTSPGGIMSYTGTGTNLKLNDARYSTLIHELLHGFGLEDFYRSANDGTPVGYFEIMANNHPIVAQPMLTFNRNTKLGWGAEVPEAQPHTSYTVRAPQWENSNEPVAFKISVPANRFASPEQAAKYADQYFVVEYYHRRGIFPDAGDRSGAIIYRVNNHQDRGNINGSRSNLENDQLYIFRDDVALGRARSASDGTLPGAVHNTVSEVIGTLGPTAGDNTKRWDPSSLYFADGTNSGIVLQITDVTDDSVTFSYSFPDDEEATPQPAENLIDYHIYYCLQEQGTGCLSDSSYTVSGKAVNGSTVTIPHKEIYGFTFGGILPRARDDSFVLSPANNTVYVWYSRNRYDVTYAGEPGSTAFPGQQTYSYGTKITLPDPGTREGYVFDHWHVSMADGSGLPVGMDAEYPAGGTVTVSGAHVITAVWTSTTIPALPATGGDLRGLLVAGVVLLGVIFGSSVAARRLGY